MKKTLFFILFSFLMFLVIPVKKIHAQAVCWGSMPEWDTACSDQTEQIPCETLSDGDTTIVGPLCIWDGDSCSHNKNFCHLQNTEDQCNLANVNYGPPSGACAWLMPTEVAVNGMNETGKSAIHLIFKLVPEWLIFVNVIFAMSYLFTMIFKLFRSK